MQLNTSIYGDSTHQVSVAPSNVYSDHVLYSDVVPTLYDYAVANTMSDPLDNSLALWQAADDSWINNQLWLRRDGNNVLQQTTTRNIKAQSLWLCVPVTYALNNNIHMKLTAYNCELWTSDTSSQYYMQANSNKRAIITGFNYNRMQTRVKLYCRAYDADTGIHGSSMTCNIGKYFLDNDTDDVPFREKYCIESVQITILPNSGDTGNTTTEHRTNNTLAITALSGFSGSLTGRIYTNTPFGTPSPNNVYYDPDYTVYAQNGQIVGLNRTNITNVTQQASFADSNSFFVSGFDSADWVLDQWLDGSTTYIATRYIGTYENFMRQIAMIGFWFDERETIDSIYQAKLGTYADSNSVCMPEIVNGRTTGNFKRGTAAADDPQALWGINWRDNVGYTGDSPYKQGGDTGDLSTVFNRLALANNLSYYTADSLAIKQLISNLNTGYQPATQDQFILDFKGTNPADYISSVIFYPANFNCPYTASSFTSIKIGAVTMTFPLGLNEADYNAGYYKEYSPITVPYYFNDFRDYAPYTVISLYVPFCGTVDLDPALFIGHTVTVRLLIDYLTGNCTGVIMRDNTAIDTISGSIGVSIPLTALANGSYQNAIKSAEIALKQAELQRKSAWLAAAGAVGAAVTGIASGNPLAIAGGIAGVVGAANAIESANLRKELAEYNIDHIAPSVDSVSAASPCNALGLDYDIHMLIRRCVSADGEISGYDSGAYAATIGNACCISDVLGNFSGLTVCSNVKLDSIVSDTVHIGTDTFGGNAATAEEIELIRQALGNGVYM